jgi:tellurite resistance protein TehA-like permease
MPCESHQPRSSPIENFFPGYFALVMATGIVSLASLFLRIPVVPELLFALNLIFYVVLWAITLIRLLRYRSAFVSDLTHHAKGATFLTVVAATSLIGVQFANLTPFGWIGIWCWGLALILWFALTYTFFTAVTVVEPKPSLETGINGAWLLVTVATESLTVLGTVIASQTIAPRLVLLTAFSAYLLGAMLYILFIALILYRWMFLSMQPEKLAPPYWINMGALAITTLAGCRLLLVTKQWSFLEEMSPFIRGFTFFFWVTCSWWIPLLLSVGFWRHVIEKVPIAYDPQYWSLVFPVGMYTACTFMLSKVLVLPSLMLIPSITIFFAYLAWALTFVGMFRRLLGAVSSALLSPGSQRAVK